MAIFKKNHPIEISWCNFQKYSISSQFFSLDGWITEKKSFFYVISPLTSTFQIIKMLLFHTHSMCYRYFVSQMVLPTHHKYSLGGIFDATDPTSVEKHNCDWILMRHLSRRKDQYKSPQYMVPDEFVNLKCRQALETDHPAFSIKCSVIVLIVLMKMKSF